MKSKKVLLGLFVGFLALAGGTVSAQTDTNFFEIGPANVGGKVSSLVVDQSDTNRTTIYAGAVSGGLYVRSSNTDVLRSLYATQGITDSVIYGNTELWHPVHYVDNNKETVLPVNSLVQGPDNTIYIGTGDNTYQVGSSYTPMSVLGKGLFRFNPQTFSYTVVPNTVPVSADDNFAAIKKLDYVYRDGKMYFYAVTNNGIYRWVISSAADWNAAPTRVYAGEVMDFALSRALKTAFFSVGNQLYKIGDVTASNVSCVNISESNTAFGGDNTGIRLAISTNDPTYLYAMVFDSLGMMENLYMTTNQQDWEVLTTSTVVPFNTNTGMTCGTMMVDPENAKRIYIAGSTLWTGEGYLDHGYFQWTKTSYSEFELNAGSYMTTVFSSAMFVHSGIHQILPVYRVDGDSAYYTYYFATDGGIYTSTKAVGQHEDLYMFEGCNSGLNNVQINDIAVCPDGTIVSGAHNNAVPLIEARMAHSGGTINRTWYDNGSLGNMNHNANIIWSGNGGHVAASKFQQVAPLSRRTIFVSSGNGNHGRSYADYLDYTNTQTWTSGTDYTSDEFVGGPAIGQMYFWETQDNQIFNDSTTYGFDIRGYVIRNNDTVWIDTTDRFPLRKGDKVTFLSRPNSEYPFEYVLTKNMTSGDSVRIQNPIQSRMLAIARVKGTSETRYGVYLSWRASDFSKVWNQDEFEGGRTDASKYERLNMWAPVLIINHGSSFELNVFPRATAMSADGRYVYVVGQDMLNNRSLVYRVGGFENVDFSLGAKDLQAVMTDPRYSNISVLHIDTLMREGDDYWFPRAISSIYVDNKNGNERLILTFEGYSTDYANVAVINNVNTDNYSVQTMPITGKVNVPAFSAVVEKVSGNIYVGTADGVSIYNGSSWSEYDHLRGVPVTAIRQQSNNLPVRHHIGHNGINENRYVFAKTKWPNALYFGTYGRGIFLDMSKVTDRENEISDPSDYEPLDIPTVNSNGTAAVSVYPNPVSTKATLAISCETAGNARVVVYDLNGRMVVNSHIGTLAEGETTYSLDCSYLPKGMYLVNVTVGNQTAAAKMIVR